MTAPALGQAPEKLSYLTIETTTWCNLACTGCSRTAGMRRGEWSNRHMSADLFRRMLPNLPRAAETTLNGVGEPSLNPDLPDIVAAAVESGLWDATTLVCNGQNKDLGLYARLHGAGLRRMQISVDSLTPDIAQLCRKGTRLDLLTRSLEAVQGLGWTIAVNVVASRFNLSDVPATLDSLNRHGPFRVMIQQYIDLGDPTGCPAPVELAGLRRILEQRRADWPNLSIQLHGLAAGAVEAICSSPWSSLAATVEGFLTPCCVNFDPAVMGFADLTRMSFARWWETPHIQRFLQDYRRQAPDFCKNCHMNTRPTQPDAIIRRRAFAVQGDVP